VNCNQDIAEKKRSTFSLESEKEPKSMARQKMKFPYNW